MSRQRLPNRRDSESREVEIEGRVYHVTVGFDASRRPCELFLRDAKPGSSSDMLLGDAAVAISIALQNGVAPTALAHSMSRVPTVWPDDHAGGLRVASIIGAAIDILVELDVLATGAG